MPANNLYGNVYGEQPADNVYGNVYDLGIGDSLGLFINGLTFNQVSQFQTFQNRNPPTGGRGFWNNVNNLLFQDNNFAFCELNGSDSKWLIAKNGGFNIPSNATGFRARITVWRAAASVDGSIFTINHHLLVDDVISPTQPTQTYFDWTGSFPPAGGDPESTPTTNLVSTTLWGIEDLTPAQINDPDFGVAVKVRETTGNDFVNAQVYYIQLEIEYDMGELIDASSDLYITGSQQEIALRTLFTSGKFPSADLFLHGKDILDSGVDLYIRSAESPIDDLDLFINGVGGANKDLNLLMNIDLVVQPKTLDLFLKTIDYEEDGVDLSLNPEFTKDMPLFLSVRPKPDGTTNLFVRGSEQSTIWKGEEANLFTAGTDQITLTSDMPLYLEVGNVNILHKLVDLFVDGGQPSSTETLDLLLEAREQFPDLKLYISGHL